MSVKLAFCRFRGGSALPIIELCVPNKAKQGRNNFLRKFAKNVYSQGGEDGILVETFRIIGTRSKWCVEFGAWDGQENSNTCNLIKNDAWSAVLIEGDPARHADILGKTFAGNDRVTALNKMIGFTKGQDTLDDALRETSIPKDFDLLVIDIDGADYHVWETVAEYRPRVVLIEFNPAAPNVVRFIQDRDTKVHHGCSLLAVQELGKAKGYELFATSQNNAFFVVAEEFGKFKISGNSLDEMRVDRENHIFPLYDGMLANTMGSLRGKVRNFTLSWDSIQVLSTFEFYGQITGHAIDHIPRAPAGPVPLDTAEQVLAEDLFLKDQVNTMPKAQYNARQSALRNAKIGFQKLRREWPEKLPELET
jgi:hypothetical protein